MFYNNFHMNSIFLGFFRSVFMKLCFIFEFNVFRLSKECFACSFFFIFLCVRLTVCNSLTTMLLYNEQKTLEISTSITIKAFRITDWFLLRLEFCAWEISTLDLTTSISCCCCSMLKFISSPLFPIQFQPVNYIHRRSLYVECFAKKSNFLRFLVVENGCELRVYLSVESRRRIHNRNDQMQKPINHFSWFTWTYIKPSTKFIAKHGEGNIV